VECLDGANCRAAKETDWLTDLSGRCRATSLPLVITLSFWYSIARAHGRAHAHTHTHTHTEREREREREREIHRERHREIILSATRPHSPAASHLSQPWTLRSDCPAAATTVQQSLGLLDSSAPQCVTHQARGQQAATSCPELVPVACARPDPQTASSGPQATHRTADSQAHRDTVHFRSMSGSGAVTWGVVRAAVTVNLLPARNQD
jgi:hypothetical protein